jgi:hypothetical protein
MLRSMLTGASLLVVLAGCTTTGHDASKPASAAQGGRPVCLSVTGQRESADSSRCAVYGRSYSREDLKRTGQTEVGPALQMLDPAITSNH